MMKNTLIALLITFLLASCQKDLSATDSTGNNNTGGTTPATPLPAQTYTNVAYGSDAQQTMDVYLPQGRTVDSTKLMVLIHGGAWAEGDKADFNEFVDTIKRRFAGYAIANINYRLATTSGNHFPTQETDVKAAVAFLEQKCGEYKISGNMVLLGASAGGHLALLQAYKYPDAHVKAVVDFYGPADMVALYTATTDPTNQAGLQLLLNGTPGTNGMLYQQSSPINFVTPQSPPTIILHGAKDDLVDISESSTLKAKLQSAGVVNQMITYPTEGHGWGGADLNDSFNYIEAFVKTNVK
jgi:acetyl esterase/lipase